MYSYLFVQPFLFGIEFPLQASQFPVAGILSLRFGFSKRYGQKAGLLGYLVAYNSSVFA